MLRLVTPLRSDVSEEHVASNMRLEKISELGTTIPITSYWKTLQRITHNFIEYFTIIIMLHAGWNHDGRKPKLRGIEATEWRLLRAPKHLGVVTSCLSMPSRILKVFILYTEQLIISEDFFEYLKEVSLLKDVTEAESIIVTILDNSMNLLFKTRRFGHWILELSWICDQSVSQFWCRVALWGS
jgi:hypothetical protein